MGVDAPFVFGGADTSSPAGGGVPGSSRAGGASRALALEEWLGMRRIASACAEAPDGAAKGGCG